MTSMQFRDQAHAKELLSALHYDRQAERAVVSTILLAPARLDELTAIVKPEDFYGGARSPCGMIFKTARDLFLAGRFVDVTLIAGELQRQVEFENVGGYEYLKELLSDKTVVHYHCLDYARNISEKATIRESIAAAHKVIEIANDGAKSEIVLATMEDSAFALCERRSSTLESLLPLSDVLVSSLGQFNKRANGEQDDNIMAGIPELDAKLKMRPGQLIVIAARPSVGKSALALNIAMNVVKSKPVLFVSLEMSKEELGLRIIASEGELDYTGLTDGSLNADEQRRALHVSDQRHDLPLAVDDTPDRTLAQIAASARKVKRRKGELGLIVIDYLQLIRASNTDIIREQQVAEMTRRLKCMAREFGCPVIVLAQLNRKADEEQARPRLSHLRESGAIEQDADIVLFVHREECTVTDASRKRELRGQAELIIAKQRNGSVGSVKCLWQPEYQRFVGISTALAISNRDSELDKWNS